MYKLLCSMLVFFAGGGVLCQTPSPIQYKGGWKLLQRDLLLHLPINPAVSTFHDDGVQFNRYYQVTMQIGKHGEMGESFTVFSVMDSLKAPFIAEAVRYTAGKWINLSGEDRTVVLPIYLLYRKDGAVDSVGTIPIMSQHHYFNGQATPPVQLAPIVITSYPAVR